jgi:hypothetical protein
MTVRGHIAGICAAAALSLALTTPAIAAPAGDEYLPKVPQSGAKSSDGGGGGTFGRDTGETGTTTLPTGTTSEGTGSTPEPQRKAKKSRDKDEAEQVVPVGSAGSGGSDGGDSSGSILLNPIVLLMIAAVIAAAVGMTLRRRQAEGDAESDGAPASGSNPDAPRESGPRTPDGEIVTRRDRPA